MASQRELSLDMCRIIACVLICAEHMISYAGLDNYVGNLSNLDNHPFVAYLFSYPVFSPIFLMTSGALILPMKTCPSKFLKRRFARIGIPMLIWTCIYIFPMLHYNSPERARLLLTQVPFMSSINGGFWFLYTLFGLYLLTPILSRWLTSCSKKELEGYLLLWIFTSTFPYFFLISRAEVGITSPFYYFCGYIGFYLLGYYIRRYRTFLQLKSFVLLIAAYLIIDGGMPWFERYIGLTHGMGVVNTNLGNILQCTAIFATILFIFDKKRSNKVSETLSKLTYGVYLINGLMVEFIPMILTLPPEDHFTRLGVASAICVAASFGIIYLLSYLPGSQYFVAYHHGE